ncbi:MAG: alpha-L-glutamate ligase-like protein [Lentisphaerales bacterium]|nr:alpha-L-glutamate ligase-like protein [Lentisphaerales bacterium]
MKFASPKTLRKQGILGMNARNFEFIMAANSREFYPRVDDKMETKKLAIEDGLAVPELICCVGYNHQLKKMHEILSKHDEFVVKPTKGCAGKGIIVIKGKNEEGYLKASGKVIPFVEMNRHVSSILTGLYSLGGQPDRAMFEKLVHFTDTFENFTHQGVPDIRVIIYKGYPVMAMTRLSTAVSDGKANLHQGAVGVGLDIATGKAIQAVQFNKVVEKHPDTGHSFESLVIPDWDEILQLSSKSYEITELGYMGADIVLDKNKGPLILELNARPGLSIQIANGCGLWNRLKLIDEESKKKRHPDERVAFAVKAFGAK